MILVGTIKSGKSSTGNAILGSGLFETRMTGSGLTREVSKQQSEKNNKRIIVVDTPGFFCIGNEDNKDTTLQHINKGISMTFPGPHAFIIVFSMLGISNTDLTMLNYILQTKKIDDYIIVVFTGRDLIERDKIDFGTFRAELPIPIQKFLFKVGTKKIFAFDNTKSDKEVVKLIAAVEEMTVGSPHCFDNKV
ncbi:unnamed protein product [Mytilus coruscus]|uniref:AIG1-type G domain-containing protein n=1 Tax=Mytilus coruscus TaxID=42192 RepID=A0A6J8EAW8_MYTCO|nr:unnamed protein product [Mytilus coruscus]